MAANHLLCDVRLPGCNVLAPRAASRRISNVFVICPSCSSTTAPYEILIYDKLHDVRLLMFELVAGWLREAASRERVLTPLVIAERLEDEFLTERVAPSVLKMVRAATRRPAA